METILLLHNLYTSSQYYQFYFPIIYTIMGLEKYRGVKITYTKVVIYHEFTDKR